METLFALLFVSASAMAGDGTMLRRRPMAAPTARVACYDALPLAASCAAPPTGANLAPVAGMSG